MKKLLCACMITTMVLALSLGTAQATSYELKPQETCPVMGGEINKEIFADHDGKRVYFCCPGCVDTFKKNPEKYLQTLEEKDVTPATVCPTCGKATMTGTCCPPAGKQQETCPVMGGAVNKKIFADHDGKRIYFCCPACVGMFKKDPGKYLDIMKRQGVAPAAVPSDVKPAETGKSCPPCSGDGFCPACENNKNKGK